MFQPIKRLFQTWTVLLVTLNVCSQARTCTSLVRRPPLRKLLSTSNLSVCASIARSGRSRACKDKPQPIMSQPCSPSSRYICNGQYFRKKNITNSPCLSGYWLKTIFVIKNFSCIFFFRLDQQMTRRSRFFAVRYCRTRHARSNGRPLRTRQHTAETSPR